jgi:hypothetical protein
MPQVDFREALSTPEEQSFSSATAVAVPASAFVAASVAQQRAFTPGVRLSRSTWTNIVFVAIASIGGLVCGFYFFNGIELLRAASSWPAEFLYPRPAAIAAAADFPQPQVTPDQPAAAAADKAVREPGAQEPFANNVWQSDLSPATQSAPVISVGTGSGSPFAGAGSLVGGLGLRPPGSDSIFQSFYQRAITTTKTITRTASSSVRSVRKKVSIRKQKITVRTTMAGVKPAAQTAQQMATQTRPDWSPMHAQSQMTTGAGTGGAGGGTGGIGAGMGASAGMGGGLGGGIGAGTAGIGGVGGLSAGGLVGGIGGKH